MYWHIAANAILLLHLAFIAFAVAGALLCLRWPRLAWLHLPTALWGFLVEAANWPCPLTALENRLLTLAGESGYAGGFIEHYLTALIYPPALNRPLQWLLAGVLLLVNIVLYAGLLRRKKPA
ncbi:DUF2784 domain-containing protein [Craterilacuibacter sp.]|uniref:DUF2784 domain-containing protein n=1 Tax=Craterilacuibacter sp. TaxID=2870909 RepID=UPI003F2EFCAE